MNEYCAERPAPPTASDAETRRLGISQPSVERDRAGVSRIVFLGAVLITQLSWLATLAYTTFKLL